MPMCKVQLMFRCTTFSDSRLVSQRCNPFCWDLTARSCTVIYRCRLITRPISNCVMTKVRRVLTKYGYQERYITPTKKEMPHQKGNFMSNHGGNTTFLPGYHM